MLKTLTAIKCLKCITGQVILVRDLSITELKCLSCGFDQVATRRDPDLDLPMKTK